MNPQVLQQMMLAGKLTPEQAQQMHQRWMMEQSNPGQALLPTDLTQQATGPAMGPPISLMSPGYGGPSTMFGPKELGQKPPNPQPPPPTTPPLAAFAPPAGPSPGAVRTPMAPQGQQGLQPDARALIDQMTGKRVHKGLGGQQLGMEGVNPALKYMLYAMRGRRHLGTGGQDIY